MICAPAPDRYQHRKKLDTALGEVITHLAPTLAQLASGEHSGRDEPLQTVGEDIGRDPLRRAAMQLGECVPAGEHDRSEEHTSELQSRGHLVCRLLLEKKKS